MINYQIPLFTAAARWAEVVIMSKSYICICVYVLDTFFKSEYKQSGQPRWFPEWPGGLEMLSVGLKRSLGWSSTSRW